MAILRRAHARPSDQSTVPSVRLPPTIRHCFHHHPHGEHAEPVVRRWLGEVLGCPPEVVPLVRDAIGRPRLGASHARLDLNWSHSGDGLLIAIGEDMALGVDLEWIRPRPRALDLARRFLATAEADWLAGLPDDIRQIAFLRLWCAKEAVLKAHGRGLAFGLDRLTFTEHADGLVLTDCDRALGMPASWSLHEFSPAAGYRAALAWRARP